MREKGVKATTIFGLLHPAAPAKTEVEVIGTSGLPTDKVLTKCMETVFESYGVTGDDDTAAVLDACFHLILYSGGSPEAELPDQSIAGVKYEAKIFIDVLAKSRVTMRQFTAVDYDRYLSIALANYDQYVKPIAANCRAVPGDELLCLPGAQWNPNASTDMQRKSRDYASGSLSRAVRRGIRNEGAVKASEDASNAAERD